MCPCPALVLAARQSPPPALASSPTVRMRCRKPTSARKVARPAGITKHLDSSRLPPAKKPDHAGHSTAANVAFHAPETARPPPPATKAKGVKVGVTGHGVTHIVMCFSDFRTWSHFGRCGRCWTPFEWLPSAAMPPLTHPRSDCSRFQRPMPAPSFARASRTMRWFKDRSTRSKYVTPVPFPRLHPAIADGASTRRCAATWSGGVGEGWGEFEHKRYN